MHGLSSISKWEESQSLTSLIDGKSSKIETKRLKSLPVPPRPTNNPHITRYANKTGRLIVNINS